MGLAEPIARFPNRVCLLSPPTFNLCQIEHADEIEGNVRHIPQIHQKGIGLPAQVALDVLHVHPSCMQEDGRAIRWLMWTKCPVKRRLLVTRSSDV
jgi:hypothetical protein